MILKLGKNSLVQYANVSLWVGSRLGFFNSALLVLRFILTRLQFNLRFTHLYFTPPNFYLFLTKRCNLSCSFCHYYGELDNANEIQKEWEFSLDDFKRLEKEKIISAPAKVCLYGGEPMLSESFFELTKYLNENGYLSSTITNSTYLNQFINELIENTPRQITISYYEGIINRHSDSIRKISRKSIVNISYIINEGNYRDLDKIFDFCVSVGAKFITLENLVPKSTCPEKPVQFNENYAQFKENIIRKYSRYLIIRWSEVENNNLSKSKINCSEPWDMVLIDKRGRVLPCCQYPLKEFHSSKVDNKIMNEPRLVEMRMRMKQNVVPELCKGCHYLYAKDPLYDLRS